MKKLVIIQTATPDYRAGFFKAIRDVMGTQFKLYRGTHYFERSVRTDTKILAKEIKNYFFLGRRALFQTGMWDLTFKDVVLVLEMNPRIVSNWILLLLRKLSGRTTVLWGHAWPRTGKKSKSDRLRHMMRSLASTIVVYTNQQASELREKMPSKPILAAPNALLSAREMKPTLSNSKPTNLIYVGRLTTGKKPMFLLKAFAAAIKDIPPRSNLIIVGTGEEEQSMKQYILHHHLEDRILMKGHISDYDTLRGLYASSLFSVSPGYVGLSITQSFGFGVPMLISYEEPHAPEIEAAIPEKNALFYKSDDVDCFCESVQTIFQNDTFWIHQRESISTACRKEYAVEAMAQVFINLTEGDGT